MNVIIPCAGRGTRRYPESKDCPKVLLEHNGIPILDQIIDSICDVVDRPTFIFVNSPRFDDMTCDHLLKIRDGRFDLISVIQEEPLGFGHAVLKARKYAVGEPVLIHASDKILDFTDMDCSESWMAVQSVTPLSFGAVEVRDGCVTSIIEKPDLSWNAVCYVRESGFLFDSLQALLDDGLLTKGEFQMTDALSNLIRSGVKVKAMPFPAMCME